MPYIYGFYIHVVNLKEQDYTLLIQKNRNLENILIKYFKTMQGKEKHQQNGSLVQKHI